MADPDASDWRWWRERRLPAGPVHLDTAAAGRSSVATLAATAAHAEREATIGAYVAQEEAEPLLAEGRANPARLLGVPAHGVAFVPSAQAALETPLAIWAGCARRGARGAARVGNLTRLRPRPGITETLRTAGSVDRPALERMLAADPPAAVHLVRTTPAAWSGWPGGGAGRLVAGVPLWVDTAPGTWTPRAAPTRSTPPAAPPAGPRAWACSGWLGPGGICLRITARNWEEHPPRGQARSGCWTRPRRRGGLGRLVHRRGR
jgi:hypothetical protein